MAWQQDFSTAVSCASGVMQAMTGAPISSASMTAATILRLDLTLVKFNRLGDALAME